MTPREAQAAAWRELQQASGLAENSPKEAWTLLSEAAQKYAKARWAAKDAGPSPAKSAARAVLPFGRSKGKSVLEADTGDLKWILPKIRESIDDPEKARWRAQNEELAAAIAAELEAR